MNHFRIFLATVLLVFCLGCFRGQDVGQVCFGDDECVSVEVADTSEEHALGLMYRESLDWGSGMLFVFEHEGYHTFWMKNTLIPLDIIWVDSDMRVVHLEHATPCVTERCQTYRPNKKALYVLEVSANYTIVNDIRVRDVVEFA